MSSGDKNLNFRWIIWTKEIFFRQSDTCPFWTKGELVHKNPLKRSILKSQFQNQEIWMRKFDFLTGFTQKQLPIHVGIKNRLNTLSHRLLGQSSEVPTKYYMKIKMMWDCFNYLNDILSHNPDEKTESKCCLVPIA